MLFRSPRTKDEKKKTDSVRKYILDSINWECEMKTLFRDKNLGCKIAVSGAIDWFFENVEKGIILEDDCLPDQSFFRFCEELLKKYKYEKRVMSISGYNYLGEVDIRESYYFSRYFECVGWASWRRAWEKFDSSMMDYKKLQNNKIGENFFSSVLEKIIYSKKFNDVVSGKVSSWAYKFKFAHFKEGAYSIHPKINMVKVYGFGEESTHTSANPIDEEFISIKSGRLKFPLIHPKKILDNKKLDKYDLHKEVKRILFKRLSWK